MLSKKLILNEEEESKKYDLDEEEGIVRITKENVYKVLFMIRYDSSYNKATNKDAEPKVKEGKKIDYEKYDDKEIFNYIGSSAYWFEQLKRADTKDKYEYCLYKAICTVDSENSTHLNGDGVGRREIWERLKEQYDTCDKLKTVLENNKDNALIKEISRITNPKNYGMSKNGRQNISFASKFCHYACRTLLKEECWDNFPIFDSILKDAVLYYAEKDRIGYDKGIYNNSKEVIKVYYEFVKIIDTISEKTKISRTGIDQLLWYYYKGHDVPKTKSKS